MSLLSLAIVVPAWNAERTLEDCLICAKRQGCFLVVVDDCSSDGTGEIARRYADFVITNEDRIGKARSVNKAAGILQFEYLLVVDSDTYLARNFVFGLEKGLSAFKADCGSGTPFFIGKSKYARKVAAEYNKMNDGTDWFYNGCCQFFKTEFLRSNPLDPDCLIEDEEMHWRILKRNLKLKAGAMVVETYAYTEAPDNPRKEFQQRLRWARGSMQLAKMKLMPRHHAPLPFYSSLILLALVGATLLTRVNFTFGVALGFAVLMSFLTTVLTGLRKALNRYALMLPFIDDIVFFESVLKRKYSLRDWGSAA
jgi:biofilm PGA synthesis N-glycosyltransferase PgaC